MSATEEEKKMVKKIENKILPTRDKYTSFLYLDSSMYKLPLIFHQQTATSWHAKTGIFILLLLYFCLFFQNKFSCFENFWLLHLPNYLGIHIIIVVKRRCSSSDFQLTSMKNDRQLEWDSPPVSFG